MKHTRYEVTARVPVVGKVKHVIKAANAADARDRMKRAHPGAITIAAKRIATEVSA